MEKIVILSFLFLACAALVLTQTTTPPPMPSPTSSTVMLNMTSSVAPDQGNATKPPTTTGKPEGPTPTSGVVNMKALAGFIASFALIALF